VLEVVATIATFFGKTLSDEGAVDDLALQLELGLPRESLELARELGGVLTRGDYLSLLAAGMTSWDAVDGALADQLVDLIGPSKATLVKQAARDQAE
jgi:hypothetical protein